MMRRFYPRQKINLTERPEWEPYTLEDEHMSQMVMESTMGTLDSMNADDVAHIAQRLLRTLITNEQKANLYNAFTHNRLELFRTMIHDASDWAWLDAYTPSNLDVDRALKNSVEDVSLHFRWMDSYSKLDAVAVALGYSEQSKFIADLLKDTIWVQDENQGDRFLIYDPASSFLVERIATKPIGKKAEGVLDWEPPTSAWNSALIKEFRTLFDELRDMALERLFHYLKLRMHQIDYNARVNFHRKFNSMLSPRSINVRAVAKEIQEALNSASLGANPFMNPRSRRLEKDLVEMTELAAASPILEFEAQGDPPEKYRIRFHGGGLAPDGSVRDLHELTITLGAEYPRSMPMVHWDTPILHPNIASGTPCFGSFAMNPRVRLVDLVEILWDMNRMAIYNSHNNDTRWSKLRNTVGFPVDPRTIRGEVPQAPDRGGDVDLIILGR